ncbi:MULTISPECIES: AraC family transcriptional regulator [Sorangium]|uniref:Transcription regulator HTH AraC N-terminal domain-containing protein n=1 Tax=Sorangium cellulosum TaxID=56 RepID=A0A4P2QUX5_SORCE|nr:MULTISPECIES: AraC family transcriptional regulator [Sorangium]AUX33926.1 uncharacterized protein SOCE836_060930 [Sorangium cellulosum]
MQAGAPAAEELDREIERRLAELAALIERFTAEDGMHATAVKGMSLIRAARPSEPLHTVYKPMVCLIAQGRKQVMLADEVVAYDQPSPVQRESQRIRTPLSRSSPLRHCWRWHAGCTCGATEPRKSGAIQDERCPMSAQRTTADHLWTVLTPERQTQLVSVLSLMISRHLAAREEAADEDVGGAERANRGAPDEDRRSPP